MKVKFIIKLFFAYLVRFKKTLILSVIFGVGIFFLVRFLIPIIPKNTTERIGLVGRYHPDELPYDILQMIGDGLTQISQDGSAEPDLASSWQTPDKGKTWVFNIQKEILWQDGLKLTSQNIVYEFSDVVIETPDEATIVFKLKNSYSPFPTVVSKPTFRKGLLGTAKWKVKNIKLSGGFVRELTLINSNYDKKIYKFYPTTEGVKLALKLGKVDKIEKILDPNPFNLWNTLMVEGTANLNQVVTIFFNTKDKLLSEKTLRQSLYYAIDKSSLGQRAFSPISPTSWAYNPQVKHYSYDPKRAKELLEELPKELQNPEIKLAASPELLNIAEKISKDWEKLGVKTEVQVSSIIPSEFQAYLTIFDIPKDPDQYAIWHSTQTGTNVSNYSNPRIDKLLEDGRSELDPEERRKIYLDFQRFLLEDAPAAFLYHPTYYTITRK